MVKSETGKKFSLIAAICYTVYALYNIIIQIFYVLKSDYATITDLNIIFWIAAPGMAVTLFMKNKKAVVVAAGVNACLGAYYIIRYFSLWHLCDFVAYAGTVALIILFLKGNAVVKKIWFVPAVVMLMGCVIDWINGGYFRFLFEAWKSMVFSIIEIVALLFTGMWLKEDAKPVKAAPVNEYATFDPQAVYFAPASSPTIGGADKLKMYKELLESGTITQEEFDAKKKQILGL